MAPRAPSPLARAAAHRAIEAERRARSALTELERAGTAITFAAVARHAPVSRQFLYSHQALRARSTGSDRRTPPTPLASPPASAPARTRSAPDCARHSTTTSASATSSRSSVTSSRSRSDATANSNSTARHPCPDLAVRSVLEGSVADPSILPSGVRSAGPSFPPLAREAPWWFHRRALQGGRPGVRWVFTMLDSLSGPPRRSST